MLQWPRSDSFLRNTRLSVALLLASVGLGLSVASPARAGSIAEPWIDTSDRDAVAASFRDEYRISSPEMAWDGNYEGCEPGESSDHLRLATLRRLNYYRALAGVPAHIVLDDDLSARAQHAALMMSAEGSLSHHPDEDYACFSATGQEASANSNLYLGRTGPAAIDGYIEDPGEENSDVGHRLTILHPPTERMGVGHVAGTETNYPANTLWVFDDEVFSDRHQTREPEGFVAWPPRGFLPSELVYPRWSFALRGADFSNATVSLTLDGHPIGAEVVARLSKQGEVPSSVLVWEPGGALGAIGLLTPMGGPAGSAIESSWGGNQDREVVVKIDGVVRDRATAPVSFTYRVTILPPAERSAADAVRRVTSAAAATASRATGLVLGVLR